MNFLNRKMFQAGGGAVALGDFDIRDKRTGQVTTVRSDFINTPGFNPYKILYDDTLEKGPAVMAILQQFQERDAPQIGPFQAKEDVGTNIADLGFGVARATEPFVRGASRLVGEVTGIQPLKEFGGKQKFDPSLSMFGGIDLFKPTYESYVPTDEDRARAMLGLVKQKDIPTTEPKLAGEEVPDFTRSTFDFRDEDMRSKVSQSEYDAMQTISPSFDPFTDPITPMLDELQQERLDLEARLEAEDIQRPDDVAVDEITSLLNDIQPPTFDIDKTEADSLLETTQKFEGLSPDELKFEIDKTKLPGMDAMDEQKEAVKKQVKVIKQLEGLGIDPDEYFNTAQNRNSVAKKAAEPGFFGTDRFLDFIRNVGAGLVKSGQMGEGLAIGAASAAEERAARDLAKAEREYEMEKLIAIEQKKAELKRLEPLKGADIEKGVKFEDEIANAIREFDEDERIISDINQIINEDLKDPTAFGVRGFITKISNDFASAAGMGAKEWEDLDSAKRTQIILDVTAQRSVRDILGESGKTISNLDRDIVAKIFGSVNVFTSPAEIQKKLENSRANIIEGMRGHQNSIITRVKGLNELKYDSGLLGLNESIIDRILDFDFENIETYKRPEGASGFAAPIKIGLSDAKI
jgi:hypothetical protein